jgi:hypothetical protein
MIQLAVVFASLLPCPIHYAPKGTRNGIFMPIMLRYLTDIRARTRTATITKNTIPQIAAGCTGLLQ